MNDLIELQGATKEYRRGSETIKAVRELSLGIAAGDFVAITGPSGSGKTSLLNLIGCVDSPQRGSVRIDGVETRGLNEAGLTEIRAKKIGFVFQQFFLLPTLSAKENVLLPSVFLRNGNATTRADELLERVGLSQRMNHLPAELSGGEMQRVAIARALINKPKILLADEPTGNLDSGSAESIMGLLCEINSAGVTVVLVTHSLDLARRAKRMIAMKDGALV